MKKIELGATEVVLEINCARRRRHLERVDQMVDHFVILHCVVRGVID